MGTAAQASGRQPTNSAAHCTDTTAGDITTVAQRKRTHRLEVRTTESDRQLIDRAVQASDTDLSEFVITHLCAAAHRVLADRHQFHLSTENVAAWDDLNSRPARDLPGLRALMQRPSPFDAE